MLSSPLAQCGVIGGVDLCRQRRVDCANRLKHIVAAAGATFMAAFPVDARFLTEGTSLLLHERQIDKTIHLTGPLKSCIAQLKAALHEIEFTIDIEESGFRAIVEGSEVPFDEVCEKAPSNWYISCDVAMERGLIAGIV